MEQNQEADGEAAHISSDGISKNVRKYSYTSINLPPEPSSKYKEEHLVGKRRKYMLITSLMNRKSASKEEIKELLDPDEPHLSEQLHVAPESEPNQYQMNAQPTAAYPYQVPPRMPTGNNPQEALNRLDMEMCNMLRSMGTDMPTKLNTPAAEKWIYIYNISTHVHQLLQNIKMVNGNSIGYMEPTMVQYQQSPQIIYASGDNYIPYGQVAYMMPQTDMNNQPI